MFLDIDRSKSRKERYDSKQKDAIKLPAAMAAISFDFDDNIAFLIRSAACFGILEIFVIGKAPSRSCLKSKSGSLYDYVTIKSFPNTSEFSKYAKENGYKIVAIEICDNAEPLYDYKFSFEQKTILLLGNESTGIPGDIVLRNDTVYIPMPGPGYCLNVSQAGTVVMNEFYKQYIERV
jgi:tRNA G18 (ribose-2'-O)-methylase SpoU